MDLFKRLLDPPSTVFENCPFFSFLQKQLTTTIRIVLCPAESRRQLPLRGSLSPFFFGESFLPISCPLSSSCLSIVTLVSIPLLGLYFSAHHLLQFSSPQNPTIPSSTLPWDGLWEWRKYSILPQTILISSVAAEVLVPLSPSTRLS